jgi:hypothetical protein
MSQFGGLGLSNENQRPFFKTDEEKRRLAMNNISLANAPKCPRKNNKHSDNSVLANVPNGPRASFGEPSPSRHGFNDPFWTRNPEMVKIAPPTSTERSLEDVYCDYPEKKLEGFVKPTALNTTADVVKHLVDEATFDWFKRWFPNMEMSKVFNAIGVKVEEGAVTDKQYTVPSEAIDMGNMKNTLADMYRQCRNFHPKGSGDSK